MSAERTYDFPNGLSFITRRGTSDYNTVNACAVEDEYGLLGLPMRGTVCFDIGAHIGGAAMLMALQGARVVAVEPVPDNARLVRRNAALNGFTNVEVIEKAAGAPGGSTITWGWYGDENAGVHQFIGNTGLGEEGYQAREHHTVETITLSELCGVYGVPYVVKLDCEGGEWPLLEEAIAAKVPLLVGEYHPWAGVPGAGPRFTDNRAEIVKRIGGTHDVTFSGPAEDNAGGFRAVRR